MILKELQLQIKEEDSVKRFFKILSIIGLIHLAFFVDAKVDIRKLGFLNLYLQVPYDYKLPKSWKAKKISFEGNYQNYARVKYMKNKNKIRLTPIREGRGVLVIKASKDEILRTVTFQVEKDNNLHKIAKEIKFLLREIDGIKIRVISNKVLIDGEIAFPSDFIRIKKVIRQYSGNEVKSLVGLNAEAQNKIVEIIEKAIPGENVQVEAINNQIILKGFVKSEKERADYFRIAKIYAQWNRKGLSSAEENNSVINSFDVVNLLEIEQPKPKPQANKKIIWVTVHYVELKKDYSKGFIFRWSPAVSEQGTTVQATLGQGGVSPFAGHLQAAVINFLPKLNWAKSFGFARVLHDSTIVVASGKEGSINSTTNLHQPALTEGGQATSIKEAVVKTSVTPTIGQGGTPAKQIIDLHVNIEVTAPTGNGGVNSKIINTKVWVRNNETAILGGLLSSQVNKSYNRDRNPSSNQNSLINLGTGRSKARDENQFVVFITPSLRYSSSIKEAEGQGRAFQEIIRRQR